MYDDLQMAVGASTLHNYSIHVHTTVTTRDKMRYTPKIEHVKIENYQ
jgi:hypothetical protein